MRNGSSLILLAATFMGCGDIEDLDLTPPDMPVGLATASVGTGGGTGTGTGGYALAPASGTKGSTSMSASIDGPSGMVSFSGGPWNVPLQVPAGSSLGPITVTMRDNGPGSSLTANWIVVEVVGQTSDANGNPVYTTFGSLTSNATGITQTKVLTPDPNHVVASGEAVKLRFSPMAQISPPVYASYFSSVSAIWISPSLTTFSRVIWPHFVGQSGGQFELVGNPANALAFSLVQRSTAATFAFYFVPFEDGDRITGLAFEGYGDGSVDAVVEMAYAPNAHAPLSSLGSVSINNAPAAWTPYSIPSFTQQTLGSGAVLMGDFKPNAANLAIGPVTVRFTRPSDGL